MTPYFPQSKSRSLHPGQKVLYNLPPPSRMTSLNISLKTLARSILATRDPVLSLKHVSGMFPWPATLHLQVFAWAPMFICSHVTSSIKPILTTPNLVQMSRLMPYTSRECEKVDYSHSETIQEEQGSLPNRLKMS